MKKILVLSIALLPLGSLYAQKGKSNSKGDGFTSTEHGVKYKVIKHGAGRKAGIGDVTEMHVHLRTGDSVIFDSRKMNADKPVPLTLQKPTFAGDPSEAFLALSVGDSAVILAPVDSMKKAGANLPWLKDSKYMEYDVVLVSAKTAEEAKKDDSIRASKQGEVDDKVIQDYLRANNLKATKTPSGLYYTIRAKGEGPNATMGKEVYVNYTGMNVNGKKFDSNMDSAFHHVEPFHFPLGQHRVIAGWDEGIALLNKGAKATLYIPSTMAYGHQGAAGGNIPPDAVLIFDVELVDIQ